MDYPLKLGTIFKYDNKFWKITGEPFCIDGPNSRFAEEDFNNRYNSNYHGAWYMRYPIIRCTKNGKEFKTVTAIPVISVYDHYISGYSEVGTKVSEDGISSGKIKRRIKYLKDKINSYTKELKELESMVKV